jgi:hypothetical protein
VHLSFRAFLSCVALTVLLPAIPGVAEAPRTIAIEIDGKAEFDVVYHRARTNAVGAVIGGLVGAGIQAGIEADQDAKKRAELYPYVAEQAWRDVFIKTMTDTLAAKGLEAVWVDAGSHAKPESADIYLTLYPETFGFRMVDSTTGLVSAYVEFDAIYSSQPISGKNKPPRESFYLTDKTLFSYDELTKDTSKINPHIESVLALAARRLTNKIIYNPR